MTASKINEIVSFLRCIMPYISESQLLWYVHGIGPVICWSFHTGVIILNAHYKRIVGAMKRLKKCSFLLHGQSVYPGAKLGKIMGTKIEPTRRRISANMNASDIFLHLHLSRSILKLLVMYKIEGTASK